MASCVIDPADPAVQPVGPVDRGFGGQTGLMKKPGFKTLATTYHNQPMLLPRVQKVVNIVAHY